MLQFYLKIQSKILSRQLLCGIIVLVIMFNIALRVFPHRFIPVNGYGGLLGESLKTVPTFLYSSCDVYLLIIFIILVYFSLGVDFYNKMEELSLAVGGAKYNTYMAKKFFSLLIVYIPVYLLTYVNIYMLYKSLLTKHQMLLPFSELFMYSAVSNVFIISLSLFILFLTRDIPVSIVSISSFYLIEEHLWRAKIMQQYGILGHIYHYYSATPQDFFLYKAMYLLGSVLLIAATLKLSGRKRISVLPKKRLNRIS